MDPSRIRQAVCTGQAAGTQITLVAIASGDTIIAVCDLSTAQADITSQYSVIATGGAINNTGSGTSTSGHLVLVTWYENSQYRDPVSYLSGTSGIPGTISPPLGRSAY